MLHGADRKKSDKKFKIHNKIAFAFVCIFVATMLSFGGVFAKYVAEKEKEVNVSSPEFYFTSNLLTESGGEYVLNPGTNKVEISIRNFVDSLRFSPSEITFTVESSAGTLNATTGTLNGSNDQEIIELSGLVDGGVYTVTATGNMKKGDAQGFKQVLSATFTVKEGEPIVYAYTDKSDDYVVYLTIWTEALAGDVTAQIPAGLVPDNTCAGLETVKTTDTQFSANGFAEYNSRTFRFFKTPTYAGGNFVVTLVDSSSNVYTAIEKKPV